MRKFINKESGAIMLVTNEFTIKQMIKNERYEEVKEEETSKEKKIEDYTKKELMTYLKEQGIEFDEKMKKEELLLLIPKESE